MRRRIILLCTVATMAGFMQSCNSDDDLVGVKPISDIDQLVEYDLYRASLHEQTELDQVADLGQDKSAVLSRNPNSIVKANYTTSGNHLVKLSGVENPSGVHGSGRITGPIYVDVEFDIVCITEVDNRATVGGEITALDLGDNPFEFPIQPGWIIYVAVEDNGNGAKSDLDRYHAEVYFGVPGLGAFCDFLAPNNPLAWPVDEWFEVTGAQDRILVK